MKSSKIVQNLSKDYSWCFQRYDRRIFLVPKVLWKHHSIQVFVHTIFFFSYRSGHIWPYRSKKNSVRSKTFLYDSLETREFLWVKTPMGIQWFEFQFLAIFSISQESIESRLKLAINQITSSLAVSNHSEWSKSPMGTVFLRVDPLPSGYGGGGGGGWSQKIASMRLKIGQEVA